MISSIGFIPNDKEISKLSKFVPDENIKNRLSYLNIPIITQNQDFQSNSSDKEDEKILKTDKVLFCTPNTEDISSIAFQVYNKEEIFVHHDLFVFSTILSSAYVGNGLVALGTFEPDIFLYDAFTEFPILPQKLLIGHSEAVTSVKFHDNRLLSCSEDKSIMEWDLIAQESISKKSYDVKIEKFDFNGKHLAFGSNTYLNINNKSFALDQEVEQIKMKNNNVYVVDGSGKLYVYDVRNLVSPLINKSIHRSAAMDVTLYKNLIATCSYDGEVKIFRDDAEIFTTNMESAAYCLEFDSEGSLFCGTDHDLVLKVEYGE